MELLSQRLWAAMAASTGILAVIFIVNFNIIGVLLILVEIELLIQMVDKFEQNKSSKNLFICSLSMWFSGLVWALWSYWQVCCTLFARIIQTVT